MEAYCGSYSGRDVEAAGVWVVYSFHRGDSRRGDGSAGACCRRVGSRCSDANCCRRVGSRYRDANCCRRAGSRCSDVNCCRRAGSRCSDVNCCRRVGSRCSDANCCRYDYLSRSLRPYCRADFAVRMSLDVYCCCCARGFGRSSTQGSWIVIRPIRVLLSVSSV